MPTAICAYCGGDRWDSGHWDLCAACAVAKPGDPAPVGSPRRATEDWLDAVTLTREAPRQVPAWQVQSGSYSHPDYVFILTEEIDEYGWPKTRLVHRLTPVVAERQRHLQRVLAARST